MKEIKEQLRTWIANISYDLESDWITESDKIKARGQLNDLWAALRLLSGIGENNNIEK